MSRQSENTPDEPRPQWGRGPTLRRRPDQRLFAAAGGEVRPGKY